MNDFKFEITQHTVQLQVFIVFRCKVADHSHSCEMLTGSIYEVVTKEQDESGSVYEEAAVKYKYL